MAKQITYLFGAGASANTIPVVADMHPRIAEIISYISGFLALDAMELHYFERYQYLPDIIKNSTDFIQTLVDDLNWLWRSAASYSSIDTLAKKFYLSDSNDKYERLKRCLIIYFTLEQLVNVHSSPLTGYGFNKMYLDKRYDSFVASIGNRTQNGIELNRNIKILSWNYDLQFELSLQRFTGHKIDEVKRLYNIFPLLNSHEVLTDNKVNNFNMQKLNGNAIFTVEASGETVFDSNDYRQRLDVFPDDTLFGQMLQQLQKLKFSDNVACRYFNFAWEGDDFFDKAFRGRRHPNYHLHLATAESIARQTEILVVVGYSFPIFNREVDNMLFSKMDKLEKVYIQDRNPSKIKSTMVNAFKVLQETQKKNVPRSKSVVSASHTEYSDIVEIPKVTIWEETNTDQFVIPYELANEN
jgi:hypothetical protein